MFLVSVIITTHNRGHMLPRAIESVLNQTFKDYELIVVDDASSDNTPEIIKGYEEKKKLRGIRIEKSKGANHARNQGSDNAQWEYLAFLDDDDYWHPHKLELQMNIFHKEKDVVLVGCRFEKEGRVLRLPIKINYSALLFDNIVGGFSMCVFRKKDLAVVGGLDESLKNSQDWDLWLRLAERGKIVVVPENLVFYSTENTDRITEQKNRIDHYHNYQTVVKRHESKMGFWVRQKHKYVVAYHTTPKKRLVSRFVRGTSYWALCLINKFIFRIHMKGSNYHC